MPRRRTGTRDQLIAAGRRLLASQSIDALTIDDIVLAAGVAKGSFYNHFADRADFAGAVAGNVRGVIEQRIASANEGIADPALRIAPALAVSLNFALSDRQDALVMIAGHPPETRLSHALNEGLKSDLEAGLSQCRIVATTADSAALYVLGVNYAAVLRVASEGKGLRSARALARNACTHLLMGLGLAVGDARQVAESAVADVMTGRPPRNG